MDHIDKDIINRLFKNARTPYLKIAKDLNVSESMVRKRVSNLERDDIIQQYSLVVNQEKLGLKNTTLMGVDVEPEHYLDVANKLKEFDEAVAVATSVGDHNFMIKALTKDNDHLTEFSQKVKAIPGVVRICPAIVKEQLKGSL